MCIIWSFVTVFLAFQIYNISMYDHHIHKPMPFTVISLMVAAILMVVMLQGVQLAKGTVAGTSTTYTK